MSTNDNIIFLIKLYQFFSALKIQDVPLNPPNNRKRFCAFVIAEVSKLTNCRGIAFTKVVVNYIFRYQLATILDLYVNGYLYRQNNLTNEFLDLKLIEKEVLVEIFEQIFQYIYFF